MALRKTMLLILTLIFSITHGKTMFAGEMAKEKLFITDKSRSDGMYMEGPYTHKNLSVFFIHDKRSKNDTTQYLPLEQALEKGLIKVNETGDVKNLTAENLSKDKHIYIQAGDIVKGGKQDRTIGHDVVLKPGSGKIKLSSFCVESGRWRTRGNEPVEKFSSSKKMLSSKKLKYAAKLAKSQDEVWKAVKEEQDKIGKNIGKDIQNQTSKTSLQLSLEDKELEQRRKEYIQALIAEGIKDEKIVGFSYAVNGIHSSTDIYASHSLFKQVWEKSLHAAANDAIANSEKKAMKEINSKEIVHLVNNNLSGKTKEKREVGENNYTVRESDKAYGFETLKKSGGLVHLNVMQR